jgi:hypothetical protein
MNWLTKKVVLKPAALIGVLLLLCGIGAGVAYALTAHNLDVAMWPGQATITDTNKLSVDTTKPDYYPGYKLIFDKGMINITKVDVYVTTTETSQYGIVVVQVYYSDGTELANGRAADTFSTGTTTTVTVTLSSAVAVGDIDYMHITLYETTAP